MRPKPSSKRKPQTVSKVLTGNTVMVAALRGLALDHVLQADSEAHKAALSMFRHMFLGHIAKVETAGS